MSMVRAIAPRSTNTYLGKNACVKALRVYYERVDSHAATSFYFYDYCGSKDISKELILDPKIPITKITLSKTFAFSNPRSAEEFEEARSRFFAEQEFRDEFMEMREGLDLGCNFSPVTLVAVLGNPWFTRPYVYWCLSALLLSWPLRLIIECNTQYADYQVTKLFGVNYDNPTSIQIHTSASQLSAPGSYMLAPSYSEALLMEPSLAPQLSSNAVSCTRGNSCTSTAAATPALPENPHNHQNQGLIVPSYSEALLYERAGAEHQPGSLYRATASGCECPCHGLTPCSLAGSRSSCAGSSRCGGGIGSTDTLMQLELGSTACCRAPGDAPIVGAEDDERSPAGQPTPCSRTARVVRTPVSLARICDGCLSSGSGRRIASSPGNRSGRSCILRDVSEPDLRRSAELLVPGDDAAVTTLSLRTNGRSLENIIENEETVDGRNRGTDRSSAVSASTTQATNNGDQQQQSHSTGAIPKRSSTETAPSTGEIQIVQSSLDEASPSTTTTTTSEARITINPGANSEQVSVKRMPGSRSTYFCLRSILRQNRRRFTLVNPDELHSLTATHSDSDNGDGGGDGQRDIHGMISNGDNGQRQCPCETCRSRELQRPARPDSLALAQDEHQQQQQQRRQRHCRPLSSGHSLTFARDNSRTLIFSSPVQAVCPQDPWGGRNVVPSSQLQQPPAYEEALNLPVLSRLRRSLTERADSALAAACSTSSTSVLLTNCPSSSSSSSSLQHQRQESSSSRSSSQRRRSRVNAESGLGASNRTVLITSTQPGRSETTVSLMSREVGEQSLPPSNSRNNQPGQRQSDEASCDENSSLLRLDQLSVASSSSSSSSTERVRVNVTGGRTKSRLTRSLTERRSKPESRRHDPAVRKSFTERIDTGCRIPGIKRMNINIETSL
ncbi:hypothetical protein QAD02_022889 [Eretmocerus hayati]|uniref:Uncharacterized protein n=1 Tax=Eretmocerus hayati TaxID=131215 RepID=A0ACC2PUI6_9HYME|nr:hypothetical protein QAD02_022889 [Eretmocerus hayati]